MHAGVLVDALKRMLRGRGITYAALAHRLDLSEASVKRMFSRRDFTLQRLEEVCQEAGIDFAELVHTATDEQAGMTHLTIEQEQEIVSDPRLMLIALGAVGNWTFDDIVPAADEFLPRGARCRRTPVSAAAPPAPPAAAVRRAGDPSPPTCGRSTPARRHGRRG